MNFEPQMSEKSATNSHKSLLLVFNVVLCLMIKQNSVINQF